ncbi:MAG: hypothetical protein GY863_03150, partial [bacterium]|nr:hypothetical protein [bacterium]
MLFHKTVISVFLSILFLSGPVQAFQSTDRKIIIYNRFAYIIEERRIEVEKGSREYELPGLPGSSIPESIFIEYDDRDLEILKQEFNPEIFNWGEILRDNMGKEIEFMLNDGSLIKGVYYGQSGNDYLIRKDDRFTALSKEEVTSFDLQVPGMIKPFTPVFRVNINSRRKKDTQLILNYIAENIVWSGVYTGIYDENAGELEVRSWASIGNRSGSELISGNIYLIAGEP